MIPKTFIGICAYVAFSLSSFGVSACSTSAWLSGATGAVEANDPSNGVPSLTGSCGFKVMGLGFVTDPSPHTDAQFRGRFYFLPRVSGAGSTDIFVAYSDEAASAELFSVKYDGSSVSVDATAAQGSASSDVAVSGNRWHLIEFSWSSHGTGHLWVDSDASKDTADTTFTSGTGAVESVSLGSPSGFGGLMGVIFFDDYVSRRWSPIGGILAGDGNQDGMIDPADIDAIINEFLFTVYSPGSTDCNLDGEVDAGDVNCAVENF